MSADELNDQTPPESPTPDIDEELAEELEHEREQRSQEMSALPPVQPFDSKRTTDPDGAETAALADMLQRNVEIGENVTPNQLEDMPKALGRQTIETDQNETTGTGVQINFRLDESGEPIGATLEPTTQSTPTEDSAAAALSAESISASTEPEAPVTPPAPASAPRIVSEAPFGGVVSPSSSPASGPGDAEVTTPDQPDIQAETETAQSMPIYPDDPTDPGSQAQVDAQDAAKPLIASEGHPTAPSPPEDMAEAAQSIKPVPPPDGIANSSVASSAADTKPDAPTEPIKPAAAPASDPDVVTEPETWDDSISPELAAVLFNAGTPAESASAESAPAETIPTGGAAADTKPDAPTEPIKPAAALLTPAPPPAAAIQLTDPAQARTLPITAEQHSSLAPDTPLEAKVRYVRTEEPLKEDKGQRIEEEWSYFKADYPGLDGRLVRKVIIEEHQYADGSWRWTYERQYEGGGRDRRDVRVNADRTYIEREDDVSALDYETGKRSSFEEEAALILAAPEREEKRGGLLSGLFGRDKDDDDDTAAAKIWRPATSSETRQVRKEGGDAFDRGLLSAIFS